MYCLAAPSTPGSNMPLIFPIYTHELWGNIWDLWICLMLRLGIYELFVSAITRGNVDLARMWRQNAAALTAARQLSYGLQKRCEVPEHFNFSDKFQYWIRWFVMRGQVFVNFSVGVFVSFAFINTIAINGFQPSPLQSTFCLVNGNLIGNAFETMMQCPF